MALTTLSSDARPLVASNVPVSEKEFETRFAALFPALVSRAIRALGTQGEDIPTAVYCEAKNAWQGGRYADPTAASGPSMFARWVDRIFRDALRRKRKEIAQQTDVSLESMSAEQELQAERWWARLSCDQNRDAVNDAELRGEAIQRLKQALLTDEERVCLVGRIWGKTLTEIQQTLVEAGHIPLAIMTICRRIESAIAKLRAVPADALTPPDMDGYEWRVVNNLTIYHAPLTTGSALARERLALSEAQFQRAGMGR